LTAARYSEFSGHKTPFVITVIADGLYLSSGFLNVILYTYTRPDLLPDRCRNRDNQSASTSSETRRDLPDTSTFGNTRVVNESPSPIEPKTTDPMYDSPEMVRHQHDDHPKTTTGRGIRQGHGGLTGTLGQTGVPANIYYGDV